MPFDSFSPNPEEMMPSEPGSGPTPQPPQGPSPEASVDYFIKGESSPSPQASVDYFIKGESLSGPSSEASVDYFKKATHDDFYKMQDIAGPGGGPHISNQAAVDYYIKAESRPNPTGDGTRGILIGLRTGIIAILIGLLLPAMFFAFAPAGMAGEGANLLMGCATGEHMPVDGIIGEDGSQGALAVREAASDPNVNGDGSEAMVSSYSQPLEGILIALNNFRVGMGSSPFFQGGCSEAFKAEPPAAPTPGASNPNGTEEPQVTPTPTVANSNPNGVTNPNPNGVTPTPQPGNDPCKDHGGVSYQGSICACPGIMDDVTICADGTQFDNPRPNDTCVPQEVCQQPPSDGGQQPPACEYKCYVWDAKGTTCMQGGWVYPGTDNACDPNKP